MACEAAGDYPIHIVVKRGRIMLPGVVDNEGDRLGVLNPTLSDVCKPLEFACLSAHTVFTVPVSCRTFVEHEHSPPADDSWSDACILHGRPG